MHEPKMEHVIDVSWMTNGKDKLISKHTKWTPSSPPRRDSPPQGGPLESTTPSKVNGKTAPQTTSQTPPVTPPGAKPIPLPLGKQNTAKNVSNDEKRSPGLNGTPPGQRRGSWFSKISSQFSSSPVPAQQTPPGALPDSEGDDVAPLPKIAPNKNAVLPHAAKQAGEGPYVPAPPKSTQAGFLQVLRRLSSSSATSPANAKNNHGLVERRVLNVDKMRERPRLSELPQAKLRRVAFCVDVEIAPMPKYSDSESGGSCKTSKAKPAEKVEGYKVKDTKDAKVTAEQKDDKSCANEKSEDLPSKDSTGTQKENVATQGEAPKPEKEISRKKEKKKKSEAERKAKKEQKRREALEKGAIPMEIHLDSDSSTEDVSTPKENAKSKPQASPTTNPGRIYRRCCQLRETDILTKITLQLPKTTEDCVNGMVEKLDLTGYFMSLPDLVTLGDFLAVVPVKEVILENCGLSDEGVRVVLAGLLATKRSNTRPRKSVTKPADLARQGGVVERLVLKNNKIGVDGWKHICLFIHMCRSVKSLDVSSIPFPAPCEPPKTTPLSHHLHAHIGHNGHNHVTQLDLSHLLSKALGERLAGPELELLNIGETGITMNQLGTVIDGALKSGLSRLGLAHNDLDTQGVQHVARYLQGGNCQGIDLGGNDLRDHMEVIAEAISEDATIWALSLANCNLMPKSLCKLFHKLIKLKHFKFIDLSHNQDLCESDPSAVGILRRFLPQMDSLKRLHLADVSMSSEQAIALAEILPEVSTLAHLNILENPKLISLADATTEETQEEAAALYASLLAAVRVSKSLVKIDIDNPNAESGEVVKALANQVVAYCLRNMRMATDLRDSTTTDPTLDQEPEYPGVLRQLVGGEDDSPSIGNEDGLEATPDQDYVIGGTGVVKALACCLKNRGEDSSNQAGDLLRDLETGTVPPGASMPHGKAKDMSKHLLASARKIRVRLQPALAQAKATSNGNRHDYARLVFLDQTIEGIINRFEDEYPDTREEIIQAVATSHTPTPPPEFGTSVSSGAAEPVFISDTEDFDTEVRSPSRSRSNSIISHSSKALVEEEGRALRVGHKFRSGFLCQEQYDLLTSTEELGNDPAHVRMITSLLDELSAEEEDIRKKVEAKGVIQTFQEDKDEIARRLRSKDPTGWDRFIESQEKARANVTVPVKGCNEAKNTPNESFADECAIED